MWLELLSVVGGFLEVMSQEQAFQETGSAALLLLCLVRSKHRAHAHGTGWADRFQLLMGTQPSHIADKHVGHELPQAPC